MLVVLFSLLRELEKIEKIKGAEKDGKRLRELEKMETS